MSNRWIAWNAPMFTDRKPYCNTIQCAREEDVVKFMRRMDQELYEDTTDDNLVHDFMTFHGAWTVEGPPKLVGWEVNASGGNTHDPGGLTGDCGEW